MKNKQAQLLTEDEAITRFDLGQYELDGMNYTHVILFDGDITIENDFDQPYCEKLIQEVVEKDQINDATVLIIINGNLVVNGLVAPANYCSPHLLVIGDLTCEVLQSYDEFIYITGNAYIKYAFDGNYNDGSIVIEGITHVPYLLNSDHYAGIKTEGATLINYYSNYDDFFEYDYVLKDLEEVMVAEVFDEKGEFNQMKLIELLKVGKSPLKEGAKPARIMILEEIEKLAENTETVTELDLSDKQLKTFPKVITQLTALRKLTLSHNFISSIPTEIENLVHLEELYLSDCQLETLPNEIGNLPKLHTLDVSNNRYNLGFDVGATEDDAAVQIPAQYIVLPQSIGNLQSLRVLKYQQNHNLHQLPQTLEQLIALEELSLYQCSLISPIGFPVVLTRLIGLKKLNISHNSFKNIPENLLNLQNLEELNLNGSLSYLKDLPDLSALKTLKILEANGRTNFKKKPYPKQELLKYFFAIDSLEELTISNHGSEQGRRTALKAQDLEGISNLKNLKKINLSLNDLSSLPAEFFTLQNLRLADLQYNNLSNEQKTSLSIQLPHCQFIF